MDLSVAAASCDHLVSRNRENRRRLTISFFGGEPMLNMALLKGVVGYCHTNYPGRTFGFGLYTNGTLIDDKTAEFFAENKITNGTLIDAEKAGIMGENGMTVKVTLTGPPQIHNKSRVTRDGHGTWESVYAGIKHLDKAGVDYIVKAVIPASDIQDTDYIREYMEGLDLGSKRLEISMEHDFFYSNMEEAIRRNEKQLLKESIRLSKGERPSFFSRVELKILLGEWGFESGCDAGKSGLFVSSSGTLYTCHISAGVNAQRYAMGNINSMVDEDKRKKIRDLFTAEKTQCDTCWVNSLCDKGCNFYKVDQEVFPGIYCDFLRAVQEFGIYNCSFFDWAHIERFCARYTSPARLNELRMAWHMREALRNQLRHIKPIHVFPACGNPRKRRDSWLISR